MRRSSRIWVVVGAVISVLGAMWRIASEASTASDLYDSRGPILWWLVLIHEAPWIGALIAVVSLVAYAWVQHRHAEFVQLETKLDVYRRSLDGVVNQQVTQHQQIAEALIDEHAKGIEFMHRHFDALNDNAAEELFKAWDREVAEWTEHLLTTMKALGCEKGEIHAVHLFGGWPWIQFERFHHWSNAKSLLKFRLDRLGEVATKRGELAREAKQSVFRKAASLTQSV